MPKRTSVVFSNPEEPAFLREIKKRTGYNPRILRDKFPSLLGSDSNSSDEDVIENSFNRDDVGSAQLVIPENIDRNEIKAHCERIQKLREIKKEQTKEKPEDDSNSDKMIFRKPNKTKKETSNKSNHHKEKINRKLLSFDD